MSILNTPLEDGKLKLKNRLVMPPMATAKSNIDGMVSPDLLEYYDEKSKGGYISLVIIEHSYVSPDGRAHKNQLSAAGDGTLEGLKKLAETVHKNGPKTVMQINHAGSAAQKEVTGSVPVGPSAIINPSKENAELPEELSKEGIRRIVESFRDAAARVKAAGFDGVEIHSAHGYLLNQFLSPISNKRTDEYGGDIAGRTRIHAEIIKAVRESVGGDFPILIRMGATDYSDDGLTEEDSVKAAEIFESAGADIIDITGGLCRYTLPGHTEAGYFTPYSEPIKKAVSVPVIVTGGVTRAQEAEDILAGKKADLVGVGRAIFKDSGWAKAAVESLKNK